MLLGSELDMDKLDLDRATAILRKMLHFTRYLSSETLNFAGPHAVLHLRKIDASHMPNPQ